MSGGSKRPYKVWAYYGPQHAKWSTIIHAETAEQAQSKGESAFLAYVGARWASETRVQAVPYQQPK